MMTLVDSREDGRAQALSGEPQLFDKLRELTRNGYLPDPSSPLAGPGILLRHESAPDLILHSDGSIDLPVGQATKSPSRQAEPPRRLAKFRTLMIIFLAAGLWFLSVAVTAGLLEGM